MYHVELRQRPHVARAFNLTAEDLDRHFVAPFLARRVLVYGEREWLPGKTKLTIYEGRELRPDEIGMGRGWGNVTRTGSDVSEQMLKRAPAAGAGRAPELVRLKERLVGRLGAGPVALGEAVALADDLLPGRRASERLGLAELAVWELLHERAADLLSGGEELAREEWERRLLDWRTWAQATTSSISLTRSSSEANR